MSEHVVGTAAVVVGTVVHDDEMRTEIVDVAGKDGHAHFHGIHGVDPLVCYVRI